VAYLTAALHISQTALLLVTHLLINLSLRMATFSAMLLTPNYNCDYLKNVAVRTRHNNICPPVVVRCPHTLYHVISSNVTSDSSIFGSSLVHIHTGSILYVHVVYNSDYFNHTEGLLQVMCSHT